MKCVGPSRGVINFNVVYSTPHIFTYRIAIHESPFTTSVRKAIILRSIDDISLNAAGISDGRRTSKQHEDSIGDHRYHESQQCTFRDGRRRVL
jgi:hypothetical protein